MIKCNKYFMGRAMEMQIQMKKRRAVRHDELEKVVDRNNGARALRELLNAGVCPDAISRGTFSEVHRAPLWAAAAMSEDYAMGSSGEDHGSSRASSRSSSRGEGMDAGERPSPAPASAPLRATGPDAELDQLRAEVVDLERSARDAEIAALKKRKAAAEAKFKELKGQSKPVDHGVKKRR